MGFFLRTWKEDESKGVPLSFDLQVSKKGFFIIGFGKMVGSKYIYVTRICLAKILPKGRFSKANNVMCN